jgi:DNA-directed RNA polymerase beta subunit
VTEIGVVADQFARTVAFKNRRKSMHRNHLIITAAAAAFVFAPGASAKPQLTTDMAHNVNFADYKTFDWASTHPQGGINSVQYQRILADISARLAAKGYQHHKPADLTMALTLGKRQKVDIDTWNHYGYHDAYVYNEGQISVDAFDSKTKRAVWHGQITDTINPKKPDPQRLQAALDKLMEQFPSH